MKVEEVMSKKVLTVTSNTPIKNLWKTFFVKKVSALPVVDLDKKIIGIIVKDDLLHVMYPSYKELVSDFRTASDFEKMEDRLGDISNKTARQVMSRKIIFTRNDTQVMRALSRMIVRRVNQLPVLSNDNKVIGIITKSDIFKALFKLELKKEKKSSKNKN